MELESYVLPFTLLSRDGSLYMQTSEGYVIQVVEHLRVGAMGEFRFVESTEPEDFVRVRHMIKSSVNLVEALAWHSVLCFLGILEGEEGDWRNALRATVRAERPHEEEVAAVETLESLIAMSREKNWRICVRGGLNVGRLVRWSNESGTSRSCAIE